MLLTGTNITKYFSGLRVLDGISFTLNKGEIVGLMGPNGAGKTTLFEIISGFQQPTSGSVAFKGNDITGVSPHRITGLGLARTFQHPRPFFNLTVTQHLEAGLRFGRRPSRAGAVEGGGDRAITPSSILELCGLSERADLPATKLTAVDRKRLEIARALACRPEVMLIDEPMQGLNPAESQQAAALLRHIRDMLGVTIFLVEHNVHALMSVCDRIIVLNYGEKIAEGTPDVVARDPQVVQAYLGTESFGPTA